MSNDKEAETNLEMKSAAEFGYRQIYGALFFSLSTNQDFLLYKHSGLTI